MTTCHSLWTQEDTLMKQSKQKKNFCREWRNSLTEREGKLLGNLYQSAVRENVQATFWYRCVDYNLMSKESCYCHEWGLVTMQLEDFSETEDDSASHTICNINHIEFPALLNAGVLRISLNFLKMNCKKHPRPEVPKDDLYSKLFFGSHIIWLHND